MREGFIITEGVACAPAVIFKNEPVTVTQKLISDTEAESEVQLYTDARKRTQELLINEEQNTDSKAAKEFLETALLYLIDPYIGDQIITKIKVDRLSAESSILQSYHDYISKLISMNDPFVMHNEFEIRNLAETLVLELHKKKIILPIIKNDCILICNNITPAQFLTLNTEKIKGILLEDGNTNSHLAIVLRSIKIPAIFNVRNATKLITNNTTVLIDAFNNKIYINPLDELIWTVTKQAKNNNFHNDNITPMIAQYKVAPDGERMRVLANIGSLAELQRLIDNPSSGIGLFRTEFLFMNYTQEPTEEEQFIVYKQIMKSLPTKYSVTFRTFDFNADKLPLYMTTPSAFSVASNNIGGNYTRNILVKQLRALLRASEFGNMSIMLPMVAEYEEVKELTDLIATIKRQLKTAGHNIGNVPQGIMIETPSGAIMSRDLAKLVDFFSIGTNDLTQYTEACSREAANHRNDELTPAVLKLINLTVKNAKIEGIPVCICGELVHNLNYLALFISIGLRDFSVAPFYLNKLLDSMHSTEIEIDNDLQNKISEIKTKREILELNNKLIINKD